MKKNIVCIIMAMALSACAVPKKEEPGEWKRSNLYLDQAVTKDGEIVWQKWPTKYNTKTGDIRVVLPSEIQEANKEKSK